MCTQFIIKVFYLPAKLVCSHRRLHQIRAHELVSKLACTEFRLPYICLASSSNSLNCSLSLPRLDRRDPISARRFPMHVDNTILLLHICPKAQNYDKFK